MERQKGRERERESPWARSVAVSQPLTNSRRGLFHVYPRGLLARSPLPPRAFAISFSPSSRGFTMRIIAGGCLAWNAAARMHIQTSVKVVLTHHLGTLPRGQPIPTTTTTTTGIKDKDRADRFFTPSLFFYLLYYFFSSFFPSIGSQEERYRSKIVNS